MKIVIAGGGKVGKELCNELSNEGNDIILIEQDPKNLERIMNKYDIMGLVGNGADYDNLVESNVQECDVFISVTPEDEINLIAAIIAKKLGATYTIARVRNPEYTGHMDFVRESLGVSMMINPELEAAKDISNVIRFPQALSVEQFANGRVSIVEVNIAPKSQLVGLSLFQFRQQFGDVLICAVTREKNTFVPKGQTVLEEEDRIIVTGAWDDLTQFYRKAGYKEEKLRSAFIVGGGRITYYLIEMLNKLDIEIKVIENNQEKAEILSEKFPRAVIIEGDGTDQEFLNEERIDQYDTVVSLTGVDEENILISLYASALGIKKIITKVSRTELIKILENASLQSIITPKNLIADNIIRFVRSLKKTQASNMESLYRIADNQVEVAQFQVKKDSQVLHTPLKYLKLKNDLLVAYIIRGERLIFPSGNDEIQSGDHIIVVSMNNKMDDIDDMLA